MLTFLLSWGSCNAYQNINSVEIYGFTWNWTLMANYSPESIRENPSFIIRSSNKEFLEGLINTLGLYEKNYELDIPDGFSTVLVFDFATSGGLKRYTSDGDYFCSLTLQKCKKTKEGFKENFDILGVLNQ